MDKKTLEALRQAEAENNLREQLRAYGMGNQKLSYDPGTLFGTKLGNAAIGTSFAVPKYAPNTILFHGTSDWQPSQYVKDAPAYAVQHEAEHILDNRAEQRYGENWRITDQFDKNLADARAKGVPNDGSWTRPDNNSWVDLTHRLATPEVVARLKQLGANDGYLTNYTPGKTVGGLPTNPSSFNEILASLSGIEQANNIDLTKDPVLKKALFSNDPSLMEAYRSVTGLRKERLDAKDLPPYSVQNTTPQKKEKSLTQKVIDVFYKDPFGDTTK